MTERDRQTDTEIRPNETARETVVFVEAQTAHEMPGVTLPADELPKISLRERLKAKKQAEQPILRMSSSERAKYLSILFADADGWTDWTDSPREQARREVANENKSLNKTFKVLKKKLQSQLDPSDWQLLELKESGLTNDEIAETLGYSRKAIDTKIWALRSKIEQQYLFPKDINRVSALDENYSEAPPPPKSTLHKAISEGRLSGYNFMDIWYTRQEKVVRYQRRMKGAFPQGLKKSGLLKAGDHLTKNERTALRNNSQYSSGVLVINDTMYVDEITLRRFRHDRKISDPDLRPLRSFCSTDREYERLRKAVHARGEKRLSSVKIGNIRHTTQKDVDAYYRIDQQSTEQDIYEVKTVAAS